MLQDDKNQISSQSGMIAPRIIFGTFGFAFAAIGISLIGFLWLAPFNQFGSPPLIFRIVGSFIALCFVVMGSTFVFGAIVGKLPARAGLGRLPGQSPVDGTLAAQSTNYSCPKCGAQLGPKVEVSPLGDVKCQFCQQWFNIHRSAVPYQ